MLFIGSGLVMVGILSAFLLAGTATSAAENSGELVSAIPAAVEFPAPTLTLQDLNGFTRSLADYEGQVVLVNNWATWCPPCKAEMPTLQAYYDSHRQQGFVLIAIEAGDPEQDVVQFVSEYALTFPVWLDPQNLSLQAFRNDALPNSYVIDRRGVVRLAWVGAINQAMLEKYVTPLLEE
jgi:peroxiredoxin